MAKKIIVAEEWGPLESGAFSYTRSIRLRAQVDTDAMMAAECRVVKTNHDPRIVVAFAGAQHDIDEIARAFRAACFTVATVSVGGAEIDDAAPGGINPDSVKRWLQAAEPAPYLLFGSVRKHELFIVNMLTGDVEGVTAIPGRLSQDDRWLITLLMPVTKRWCNDCDRGPPVRLVVSCEAPLSISSDEIDWFIQRLKTEDNFFHDGVRVFSDEPYAPKVEVRDGRHATVTFDVEIEGGAEAVALMIEKKAIGVRKSVVEVTEVSRGRVLAKLHRAAASHIKVEAPW